MFESDIELLKLTLQRVLQLSSKLSLILHSERSLGGLGSDCLNLGPIILKDGNSLLFIKEACTKYYCYTWLLYIQYARDYKGSLIQSVCLRLRSNAPF